MIFIATPTSGTPRAEYVLSLLRATNELKAARIQHAVALIIGVSPISLARSEAVSMFLDTDATHLFFVDDDMTFSASDIIAIAAAGKPIVGAMCPRKSKDPGYCVMPLPDPKTDGDLVTVEALGTGFLCVSREVIEARIREIKPVTLASGVKRWPIFTERNNGDGEYLSEDYAFCERARERGFDVWAHTGVSVGHVGAFEYRSLHTSAERAALVQGGWEE